MARAVNVLLDVGENRYDMNKMGLVRMEFNRFLGSTQSATSGVLSDLTITMFDKTGHELLSILQAAQSNIRVSYGFEDNLSEPYNLNLIKFNSTYNNLGAMVSVGAIGSQTNRKFPAESYRAGTNIKDIVIVMAKRNGWYIGPQRDDGTFETENYIDIDLALDRTLFKSPDETDIQFLETKILPLANQSAFNTLNTTQTRFWDFQLTYVNGRLTFFFRRYSNRGTSRRIWKYSYGESENNSIISLTNFIDYSFLIQGLSIRIPMTATDALLQGDDEVEQTVKNTIENKLEDIAQFIEDNNLPQLDPRNFVWNVEVYPVEDTGNVSVEDIVLQEIQNVINAISTIELEIIGNPKIMPTDLIDLTVKNKDGDLNIISSTASSGSYWRVIQIKEQIGMDGYSTKLQLVREVVNFI